MVGTDCNGCQRFRSKNGKGGGDGTGRVNKIVRNPYHTGEKLREESRWWISKRKKFEVVSGSLSVVGVVGTKKKGYSSFRLFEAKMENGCQDL